MLNPTSTLSLVWTGFPPQPARLSPWEILEELFSTSDIFLFFYVEVSPSPSITLTLQQEGHQS